MDRRDMLRVPESRLITKFYAEQPFVASTTNLSATGLFTVMQANPMLLHRRLVQLEIPVPEASDSVWVKGQVMYRYFGGQRMGTGIRFLSMADRHRRLIVDLVEARRTEVLGQMFDEIRRHKQLAGYPLPFMAPPPARVDHKMRMSFDPQRLV